MNPTPPRVRLPAAGPSASKRTLRPASHRGHQSKSAGQALVEFALVIPVMLLMLAIAIDFGRLFFSYIEITNAAREGAAFGGGGGDLRQQGSDHLYQEAAQAGYGAGQRAGAHPVHVRTGQAQQSHLRALVRGGLAASKTVEGPEGPRLGTGEVLTAG